MRFIIYAFLSLFLWSSSAMAEPGIDYQNYYGTYWAEACNAIQSLNQYDSSVRICSEENEWLSGTLNFSCTLLGINQCSGAACYSEGAGGCVPCPPHFSHLGTLGGGPLGCYANCPPMLVKNSDSQIIGYITSSARFDYENNAYTFPDYSEKDESYLQKMGTACYNDKSNIEITCYNQDPECGYHPAEDYQWDSITNNQACIPNMLFPENGRIRQWNSVSKNYEYTDYYTICPENTPNSTDKEICGKTVHICEANEKECSDDSEIQAACKYNSDSNSYLDKKITGKMEFQNPGDWVYDCACIYTEVTASGRIQYTLDKFYKDTSNALQYTTSTKVEACGAGYCQPDGENKCVVALKGIYSSGYSDYYKDSYEPSTKCHSCPEGSTTDKPPANGPGAESKDKCYVASSGVSGDNNATKFCVTGGKCFTLPGNVKYYAPK